MLHYSYRILEAGSMKIPHMDPEMDLIWGISSPP
jgi:hypothetical protein